MPSTEKIAIGSDHAGFQVKARIKEILARDGKEIIDLGTDSEDSCDYPDYARAVAEAVARGDCQRGIIACGSGVGVSIVANKVRGVRAALCKDEETARLSRQHNDANVLCIAARSTEENEIEKIVESWLSTSFEGGRHQRRIEKIEKSRAGECEQSWYSIH